MGWLRGLKTLSAAVALSAGMLTGQAFADTLISNVTVLDGTGAPALPGASVLISGDRIAQISTAPIQAPAGTTTIDGSGKFLIPGLIDSHVHVMGGRQRKEDGTFYVDRALALTLLQGYLYSGVTTVYDSGNNPDFIFGLRTEERAGSIKAPRILATGGLVTTPGGYADAPTSIAVDDFKEDLPKLQAQVDRKPDMQKMIYDHLGHYGTAMAPVIDPALFQQVAGYFNQKGIPTTVHVYNEEEARVALHAGINGYAHPIHANATDDVLNEMAMKRTPVSTTLTVYTHIAQIADSNAFLDAPLFAATLPAKERERQKVTERQRYITSGMSGQFKLMIPFLAKTLKKMHDSGVILALGTDRTWGASVHMELDLLAKAGIPVPDLLKIATYNSAFYLHREKDLGSIERGKIADLVLLNEDPSKSVAAYSAISAVFKNGEQVNRGALNLLPANQGK